MARSWGYEGLHICNLLAYRSTDPKGLRNAPDPYGPGNDRMIRDTAKEVDGGIIIWGWGTLGSCLGRGAQVKGLLVKEGFSVHRLGLTKKGFPKHPLYLPKKTIPELWMGLMSRIRSEHSAATLAILARFC